MGNDQVHDKDRLGKNRIHRDRLDNDQVHDKDQIGDGKEHSKDQVAEHQVESNWVEDHRQGKWRTTCGAGRQRVQCARALATK